MLQVPECDKQFVRIYFDFFRERLEHVFQRLGQIAIFVERIYQHAYQYAIAAFQIEHRKLAHQVVAQLREIRRDLLEVRFVPVVPAAAAVACRGAGIVVPVEFCRRSVCL